jgi:hypothetical protein
MQVCDVVVNKPFKTALKEAFRDWVFDEWRAWRADNPADDAVFAPRLTVGGMKPHMVAFVQAAMDAISTPEMASAISEGFRTASLVMTSFFKGRS